MLARHPDWWKTCQVLEVVRGLDWTEGDMMGEAVKLVWNSATEATDHIACKLDQPTITLLRKVRRVARRTWLGSRWRCYLG